MKIGITDCGEKYPIYEQWVLSQNVGKIETIKLGYKHNNLDQINQCDGIVLTGGEDIHPQFYNKPEYLSLCNPNFMDARRDEFEWKVCEYTFKNQIPVLGICRGLQLVNVFLGGTLIPDIPTAGKNNHSKFHEGKDRYHTVDILTDSTLAKIINTPIGEINSAHHQSADIIANSLQINALSEDGIVEGLEWASLSHQNQYLMLVQWHPERITNTEQNNFSYKIRQNFVENIQSKIQ
ncbi:gamma-glutamyl-gamma-aminobutyrate hydrolase family protein [Emticicia sp. SJ17W-69]|uniref:gamma-glutamyl-gamma-aminobutyrate hydrolase family protein n=1 Tax=Emticicia sp. SJ17W-69 TaxID=3421657 RepID=UPI003EBCC8A8